MDNQLIQLMVEIAKDYSDWKSRGDYGSEKDYENMIRSLNIESGRKYHKITNNVSGQTMVWGFIVKQDDKKFRAGDILKAASWAAPARNKPRGNILDGDFSWVRWTGPEYL
jgi:hypothetical protein